MDRLTDLADLPLLGIWDGVVARSVEGGQLSLAVVELDPNANVPEHHHANEQLGIVLRGSVRFRIGDEERELGPGGTWRIPPDVPHEVTAGPEGAEVIDVFAPARADWAGLDRLDRRDLRWPGV